MNRTPEQRLLNLMKKVLSFLLWPEPPLSVATFNFQRAPFKRGIINAIDRALATRDMQLCERRRFSDSERDEGLVWPGYADTMIGLKRLDSLQECIEAVLREQVPGHLIETGVWRGGASIFMRAALAAYGAEGRKVFVADSFEGLPPPDRPHIRQTRTTHTTSIDISPSRLRKFRQTSRSTNCSTTT